MPLSPPTAPPSGESSNRLPSSVTDRLVWTWAKAIIAAWRTAPVRGGGRLVRALAVDPARRRGESVVDIDGLRILVDPANPPEEAVLLWRRYEEDVLHTVQTFLPCGGVGIDIGANCGVITLYMCQAAGPSGRVISADPSETACHRVRQQAAINGFDNIDVTLAALVEEVGQLRYQQGRVGIGVLPELDQDHVFGPAFEVSEMRLDDLVQDAGLHRLDLIKIDTDGSELGILRSGIEALRAFKPVLSVELNAHGLARRGHSADELVDHLRLNGYELYRPVFHQRSRAMAAPARFSKFRSLADLPETHATLNVLAIPTGDSRVSLLVSRVPMR
jgi:FkbM family methyltransferase